jgi:hypothetical protein
MQQWTGVAIMAAIAIAGVLLTAVINMKSNARIEGTLAADVANSKDAINELKMAKGQMWGKINEHDTAIARLKLHTKLPHNGD